MDIDGKKLFDMFLFSTMPSNTRKLISVFTKRGIGVTEAMEMLLEMFAIADNNKNSNNSEGKDDGKSSDS